ncbi:MAG: hypothetical protein R3A49_09215 [Acidimicrobiia bacterium]
MAIVVGALAVGIILLIASVFVVREARHMAAEPPPPVFNVEEAYDWVVAHVPDDVAGTLTPDDVRRILDVQIEYFRRRGVSGNGSSGSPPGSVIVGGSETVDYILDRCREAGEEFLPEQVHAVVDTQLGYLRAIGAVGPRADDGPDVGGGTPPSDV